MVERTRKVFPMDWCIRSQIEFACGFLAVVARLVMKLVTQEFSALVMDNVKGPRVSCQPCVFKVHGHMSGGLIVDSSNFNQISNEIYDGQSREFHLVFTHRKRLGTNEVNGNILPRYERCLSTCSLTVSTAHVLVSLACITSFYLFLTTSLKHGVMEVHS
jgi:hypothetical protein